MSRTMWDGVNQDAKTIASLIKPGDVVAYYIDGIYKWSTADIALFPDNEHVTITVLGNPADAADCETGDMTVEEAAHWIIVQKAHGYARPTVYRSLAFMQDIRKATGSLVMGKDWDAWVADYDNKTGQVYTGAAVKQYTNSSFYDENIIFDDGWPHREAAPVPVHTVDPKWPAGLTLARGNVGNAVQALQHALSGSGIPGVRGITVDGVFGNQTYTAVGNLEAEQHIGIDGVAGQQVRTVLVKLGRLTAAGQVPG